MVRRLEACERSYQYVSLLDPAVNLHVCDDTSVGNLDGLGETGRTTAEGAANESVRQCTVECTRALHYQWYVEDMSHVQESELGEAVLVRELNDGRKLSSGLRDDIVERLVSLGQRLGLLS